LGILKILIHIIVEKHKPIISEYSFCSKVQVDHKSVGNTYVYYPLLSKEEYTSYQMKHLMKNYFGGSFTRLAAFFAKDNDMSLEELEALLKEAGESKS
jgi:predicted transcriptional regulator